MKTVSELILLWNYLSGKQLNMLRIDTISGSLLTVIFLTTHLKQGNNY